MSKRRYVPLKQLRRKREGKKKVGNKCSRKGTFLGPLASTLLIALAPPKHLTM
jgi:hypothetical protein